MNEVMARESFPHDEKLDKILVHGVAFYENYTDGLIYYRPLGEGEGTNWITVSSFTGIPSSSSIPLIEADASRPFIVNGY